MGVCLDKPITEKFNEQGSGNGLSYGVASMQGWRVEMEDTHVAKTGLGNLPEWSFFAVFDGHAGASASAYCASNLLETVLQTEDFKNNQIAKGIRSGFLSFDEEMRELPEVARGSSGSTAVCAFVSPDKVYIANCGDSRAIICRDGVPALTSHDHKPVLPEERERILHAGGSVMISRVNGSLAVSRALGDYAYKSVKNLGPCEQLVSPEPEVLVWERDLEKDEFLVLACDGVWDVMCNEDVCSYVQALLKITNNLQEVTNRLIDTCLAKVWIYSLISFCYVKYQSFILQLIIFICLMEVSE